MIKNPDEKKKKLHELDRRVATVAKETCNGKTQLLGVASWDPGALLPFCHCDHVLEILDALHILNNWFSCTSAAVWLFILYIWSINKNNKDAFFLNRKVKNYMVFIFFLLKLNPGLTKSGHHH